MDRYTQPLVESNFTVNIANKIHQNSKKIIKSFTHKLNVMKFEQWTDPDKPPKDVKLIKKGVGELYHRPCKVGDWFSKKTYEREDIAIIPNKEFKENYVEVIGKTSKKKLT